MCELVEGIVTIPLHQLKSLYGPRAGTFLSNAGVTQVFNVNDVETAAWVSKTLGATTEAYETTSQSISYGKDAPILGTRSQSTATHLVRRDLLTPDEVMRLPSNCLILLRQGAAPILASKVTYYADPEFRSLFGPADTPTPPSAHADAVPAEQPGHPEHCPYPEDVGRAQWAVPRELCPPDRRDPADLPKAGGGHRQSH